MPSRLLVEFLSPKRPRVFRGAAALAAVVLGACSSGEVRLTTGEESEEISTVESDFSDPSPTGGAPGGEGELGSGGRNFFGQGGFDGAGSLGTGGTLAEVLGAPCILWGACGCETQGDSCKICSDSSDCGERLPLCDGAANQCVECLSDSHCVGKFGFSFSICDFGKCVQCRGSGDCPENEICSDGFCGSCLDDKNCREGELCYSGHCVPRKF